MAKVYEYKDEKFSVNVDKENDCALKVSKDGFTATVSVQEKLGKFRVSGVDPVWWTPDPLRRRSPQCHNQDHPMRRSSGSR